MKTFFVAAAVATTALIAAAPIAAPVAIAQSKTGIGMADLRVAAARSNAFTVAMQQIEQTYAEDIRVRDARAQVLQAEINVLIAKLNEDAGKPNPNRAALETQARTIQEKRTAANTELDRMSARVDLATAFVEDQISLRMNDAVRAAMRRLKIDLLLQPDAVLAREPNVDVTDAVVQDLNAILPNVTITPPEGYQPGALVAQRNQELLAAARAGQAAPAAATPAAPTTQPTTR